MNSSDLERAVAKELSQNRNAEGGRAARDEAGAKLPAESDERIQECEGHRLGGRVDRPVGSDGRDGSRCWCFREVGVLIQLERRACGDAYERYAGNDSDG